MRTIQMCFVAIIAFVILGSQSVMAQGYSVPKAKEDLTQMSSDELWDRGNTAYANDNFVDAERYYNQIVERGVSSPRLYYNIGNVHHKRGEIGKSLLYYYKALKLSPWDDDVRHNIEIAEAKTKDKIERIPTIFLVDWVAQIRAMMGCMGWSIVSIITFALLLAALMIYLLAVSLRWRRVGFWSATLMLLFFVTSTRFALTAREEIVNPSEAIVMSGSLSVKSSPSDTSTELFILHEGTKVRVKSRLEGWCEVVIDDGKRGWVECRKIERI